MYRVESLPISIPIGRQGENHAMKIEIDCSSFLAEWPQATITAMLRRSVAENPYILVTSIDSNGILTWEPTAHDTGIEGDGQIEIRAVENDVLAKSVTAIVCVERSLTPPEPDTPIDWVEDIKSDIAQSVTSAANSASDAAKSAASAQESAAAAAGSTAAAQSSANAAAGSASAASASAAGAATSADAASGSASAAAQSAAAADTSAKASAASAAEAAGTLDSVKASADAAAGSARAAAESASGAASSKSSAAQAATDAVQAASAAAGSASQSAAARDVAQAAATAASAAASDAAASAAKAEKAAQDAAGIIDDTVIAAGKAWSSKHTVDKLLPMQTVTGNPVVVETLEGYPMSIKASWAPKQDGSGTPSPDNVRPIKGREEVTIELCGKNLLNWPYTNINVNNEFTERGITYIENVEDRTIKMKGVAESPYGVTIDRANKEKYGKICGTDVYYDPGNNQSFIYPLKVGQLYDKIIYPQLELGSKPTQYEKPITHKITTLNLPTTIYGGEVNAVTGAGTKQWEHITSYAGESLPGEWMSDRDAYTDGAQPTIGAQVVYKLATPETFAATGGGRIDALAGTNVFVTDADTLTATAPTPPQTTASAAEAQAAKMDYIAMMADVDMDALVADDTDGATDEGTADSGGGYTKSADTVSGADGTTDMDKSADGAGEGETDGKQEV